MNGTGLLLWTLAMLVIGALLGFVTASLMCTSRRADDDWAEMAQRESSLRYLRAVTEDRDPRDAS